MSISTNIMLPPETKGGRPRQVKALVFDFDGTLAGLEIDFDHMRLEILDLCSDFGIGNGASGRYVLEILTESEKILSGSSPERARQFMEQARRIIEGIEMEAAERGSLFPETRRTLSAFSEAGLKLAIITRNFGGAVRTVFPDLDDFVPVFLPREAVQNVKPDPRHLLAALEALGESPEESIMVGDHPIDIETGRRAGSMTAGLASGRIGLTELSNAGPDLAFNRLIELADFLLQNCSRLR